ncbi:MAG: hypothetical protein WCG25_09200 [bacterium]
MVLLIPSFFVDANTVYVTPVPSFLLYMAILSFLMLSFQRKGIQEVTNKSPKFVLFITIIFSIGLFMIWLVLMRNEVLKNPF